MAAPTIFSRFLAALDVPHTNAWSDSQFRGMTFKSLYGLSHLLASYGVKNVGARLEDKAKLATLETPFLAQTRSGIFVIVTAIDSRKGFVEYDSRGEMLRAPLADFLGACNGVVLLARPSPDAAEPDYAAHRFSELVARGAAFALPLCALAVFLWFFVTRGLYLHLSTWLLALFDCVGLYFSYLLVQKSLNIHTAASDRVCGVLEQGGCDSILQTQAAKLFGVFAWSEVGFGYFGVSLAALLMFPDMWGNLAICNLCCLPYTVWSITYQKFKAKHWCTLCVGVQTTLWLLFFCYLGGGWLIAGFPLEWGLLALMAAYVCAVLFINRILAVLTKLPCHENYSGA